MRAFDGTAGGGRRPPPSAGKTLAKPPPTGCKVRCTRFGAGGIGVTMPTPHPAGEGAAGLLMMDATRRGNYESGSDYVLEYGELRFTFNERDFTERVEQAAVKLGFVPGPLQGAEREDLVNLAVNGEVTEPASPLGEHIVARWHELAGNSERSLVHWLRRLVFRGAWLDQRVKEGAPQGVFDAPPSSFGYAHTRTDTEAISRSP